MSRYRSAFSPNVPPWAYVAFLVVAVGWTLLVPGYWVFLGSVACLTTITALGLTVLVGWAGQISICQAALTGTSLYITGWMLRDSGLGLPFLVALAGGIFVAVVLAALPAIATAKMSAIYVMVLTLGLQVTIERTVFANVRLTGGRSVGTQDYHARPKLLISFESERSFYLLCLAAVLTTIVLLTLFRKSRHGRALLLVRTNKEAAAAVGISPWRYKILAFAIAGGLAGLAGALTAPLYRSPPTTLDYFTIPSLFLLAIPVAAGFESLLAVLAVSFTFTMLPHALQWIHISPFLLGGIGLVAGTYIGPRGLGGAVLDLFRRLRVRAAAQKMSPRPDAPAPTEVVLPGDEEFALLSNGRSHVNHEEWRRNGDLAERPGFVVDLQDRSDSSQKEVQP